LYVIARRAFDLPVPRWSVPSSVLCGLAGLIDKSLLLVGRRDRRARTALDKLLGWACYDSTRIGAELGYRPARTLERFCEEIGLQGLRK
jgi:hypothetical protein